MIHFVVGNYLHSVKEVEKDDVSPQQFLVLELDSRAYCGRVESDQAGTLELALLFVVEIFGGCIREGNLSLQQSEVVYRYSVLERGFAVALEGHQYRCCFEILVGFDGGTYAGCLNWFALAVVEVYSPGVARNCSSSYSKGYGGFVGWVVSAGTDVLVLTWADIGSAAWQLIGTGAVAILQGPLSRKIHTTWRFLSDFEVLVVGHLNRARLVG